MAKSPNWTVSELIILAEAYPRLGKCKELQELFPTRTLEGICLKANRSGLRVVNNIRKGRTNEEYLSLLEATNFVSLEEYKGSTTPILHMCGICEHEWLARPQQILREGTKCPKCDEEYRAATSSHRLDEVAKVLVATGFTALSEYTGALDKIKLRHNHCGYEWDTIYSYIQQGSGCPLCNNGFGSGYSKGNIPEKANIYLFKITTTLGHTFYKIGVTIRPVHRRELELKSSVPNIRSIELIHSSIDKGTNILIKEAKILHTCMLYFYKDKFEGYTELLDISNNLDYIKELMDENI